MSNDNQSPSPEAEPEIARGLPDDTRLLDDPGQVAKVTPVLPTDGEANSEEQSRASEQDGPPAMPTEGALREEELPSVWEAVKDDDAGG